MAVVTHIRNLGLEYNNSKIEEINNDDTKSSAVKTAEIKEYLDNFIRGIKTNYRKYSTIFHPDKIAIKHSSEDCDAILNNLSNSSFYDLLNANKCVNAKYTSSELGKIQSFINSAHESLNTLLETHGSEYLKNYFECTFTPELSRQFFDDFHSAVSIDKFKEALRSLFDKEYKSSGLNVHLHRNSFQIDKIYIENLLIGEVKRFTDDVNLQDDLLASKDAKVVISDFTVLTNQAYEQVQLQHLKQKIVDIQCFHWRHTTFPEPSNEMLMTMGEAFHQAGFDFDHC